MGSVGKWKFGMANFLIFSPKRTRLTSGKAEASEMIYDPQRSQGANKYVKYDSWFLSKFFADLSWPGVGAYVGRSSGWVHGLCRFEEDRSLFGRHRCGSSRTGWHSCGRLEGHWSCVGATEAGQVLFLTSNWHSPDPTETWLLVFGGMIAESTFSARLLHLPRLRNWLGNRRRWIETLNVVSSLLFRVQYKNETPNQPLKFKTHNVVSSVLWRVHYKHETPNQSLKLKTLNMVCSMCSQVQWNHETPNQSLN